jgi:formylmethanofuran dehydrogenase subunit C
MSDVVVLTLRAGPTRALELAGVTPDRLSRLAEREIGALPVRHGGRPAALGDFFAVNGERALRVRVEGDLRLVEGLGAGMGTGEMVVLGDVGRDVGVAMTGGAIEVRGAAGDNAGGAGPGAARGMTGGEIIIRGRAGDDAGARMRRGLVVVTGDAGRGTGRGMIAGTVVVCGASGPDAGRWTKRGSLVALGGVAPPATFRYACTYRPPHVRLLLCYLRARYHVPVSDRHIEGRYERYSGDMAELGKGEILQWVEE